MTRALVGTLYSGENELERCVEAIRAQRGVELDHFVVRGLPNREAHDALYRGFMERAADADLFVKVDADMVLADPTRLAALAERFATHADVDQAVVDVWDFFSDRLVTGLHAYRSGVRWPPRDEGLFVDASPLPPERIARDWCDLAPAAFHCPDPGPYQAFHFGLHKGLKLRAARAWGRPGRVGTHWDNVECTWQHYRRRGDRRLLLACLGAELALLGRLGPEQVDWDAAEARHAFERHAEWSTPRLERRVRWLRLRTRRGLPASWWRARWTGRQSPWSARLRRIGRQAARPLAPASREVHEDR